MKAQTFPGLHCEVRPLKPTTIVYGVDFVVGAGAGTDNSAYDGALGLEIRA